MIFIIKTKNIDDIDDIDKYNLFKYFSGYNDNDVIKPLYLCILQTTGYTNKFDKNKLTMSLMIKDIQLLKN